MDRQAIATAARVIGGMASRQLARSLARAVAAAEEIVRAYKDLETVGLAKGSADEAWVERYRNLEGKINSMAAALREFDEVAHMDRLYQALAEAARRK